MQFLFAALIFLIVFLAFALVSVFMGEAKPSDVIRDRLESIQKESVVSTTARNLDLVRDELLSSIPTVNKMLVRWTWPARLQTLSAQAGMSIKPGKLVLISAVCGLIGYEATELYTGSFLVGFCVGVPSLLMPLAYVFFRRSRRMSAFERQFPEAIDLLARSVRAGHSFVSGMEIIATDLPTPISTEFRITFDEQRFGLPLRDALMGLCDRVPLIDVRLFVIALLVQKETGGNLVEILDNLAHVIRERFRIAGEVRIRTAQGRLTAAILMVLPVAMLLILRVIAGDYVNVLFTDSMGRLILIGGGLLQVLGAFVIWRIIQIKV
jgi:tight adherence protein B